MQSDRTGADGAPKDMNRRNILRGTGASAVAATALAAVGVAAFSETAEAQGVNDAAVLNFALNLEYLEAEYYSIAVFGTRLDGSILGGVGTRGTVTGGRQVQFATDAIRQYATEIANDEINHVKFLRSALGGAAVAEPSIDIVNSFNTLAQAAGLGSSFDPYASENNFLLGSYVFEDVGVTAYHGASTLIQNKQVLLAAAGILAVEAYHASQLRLLLFNRGFGNQTQAVSNVRASLSGANDDQGVVVNGSANIVLADANSVAFSRTPRQVLNIVYGAQNASSGLFYPQGLNGAVK